MSNTGKKKLQDSLPMQEIFVRKISPEREQAIDDVMGLQLISIRLQKSLIRDLKILAKHEGISYQPLIRQILTRYVRKALHDVSDRS